MEYGNIVAEYNCRGIRVRISDGAYAGKTESEMEIIRENARSVARSIEAASIKRAKLATTRAAGQ